MEARRRAKEEKEEGMRGREVLHYCDGAGGGGGKRKDKEKEEEWGLGHL